MRTPEYLQSLEEVKLFCSLVSDGIVVAEINDAITKNEFLDDLMRYFLLDVISVRKMSRGHLEQQLQPIETKEGSILVLDELVSDNDQNLIANLNYNRDWLLSLYKRIIIILPTIYVTDLIRYSNNFWSCVSLHKVFSTLSPCFISPYFIDEFSELFESNEDVSRKKLVEKEVYQSNLSATGITAKHFPINVGKIDVRKFSRLIDDYLSKINFSEELEILEAVEFFFTLGEKYYHHDHFSYALRCFKTNEGIIRQIKNVPVLLQVRVEEAIAKTYFRMHEYVDSVFYYNRVIGRYDEGNMLCEESTIVWTEPRLIRVWNNLAAACYCVGEYDFSLTCLHSAYKLSYEESEQLPNSGVLYNLGIVSHVLGNYEDAIEYIDAAIETVTNVTLRRYTILESRYLVLKASILAEIGDLLIAERILRQSLDHLREELYEFSWPILEAHYTYAFTFFRENKLEKALSCARKAESIAKKLKTDKRTKTLISILLGEIYYYLNRNGEATRYITQVLSQASLTRIISDDLIEWMKSIRN